MVLSCNAQLVERLLRDSELVGEAGQQEGEQPLLESVQVHKALATLTFVAALHRPGSALCWVQLASLPHVPDVG